MDPVNIQDAKTRLSTLVDQAAQGTDVIISRNGKPVARLTAIKKPAAQIRFGVLKGAVKVSADFDVPLPDALIEAIVGR